MPDAPDAPDARALWGRRNYLLFGAAVLALGAGYAVLASGQASAAAVLLVLGYCVLFPLAIAL